MDGAGQKSVAVGLSGGVDSAVAALLLRDAGFAVTGVTMALGLAADAQNAADAGRIAARLGIPFRALDLSEAYRRDVLDHFRATYLAGETPNPCVRCNQLVKFGRFPEAVRAAGIACDFLATGHYARTEDGRLFAARDLAKDQSYFLHRVPRETLRRVLFPLGGLLKAEVREIARAHGFEAADRVDSQDFCAGAARDVVGAADRPGDVVDASGRVLGRHAGFWRYTVGQRKGLGIGGGTPFYVTRIDAARNEVVVGPRAAALCAAFSVRDRVGAFEGECFVKVRSAARPAACVVSGDRCTLAEGVLGVAPGQSAVWYSAAGEVLGGGVICQTRPVSTCAN